MSVKRGVSMRVRCNQHAIAVRIKEWPLLLKRDKLCILPTTRYAGLIIEQLEEPVNEVLQNIHAFSASTAHSGVEHCSILDNRSSGTIKTWRSTPTHLPNLLSNKLLHGNKCRRNNFIWHRHT
eukprot:1148682-Pelagomonas_calceolata.AAC.14